MFLNNIKTNLKVRMINFLIKTNLLIVVLLINNTKKFIIKVLIYYLILILDL